MSSLNFQLLLLSISPILINWFYNNYSNPRVLFFLRLSCLLAIFIQYFLIKNIKPEILYERYESQNWGMRKLIIDFEFVRSMIIFPVYFIMDKIFNFKK